MGVETHDGWGDFGTLTNGRAWSNFLSLDFPHLLNGYMNIDPNFLTRILKDDAYESTREILKSLDSERKEDSTAGRFSYARHGDWHIADVTSLHLYDDGEKLRP